MCKLHRIDRVRPTTPSAVTFPRCLSDNRRPTEGQTLAVTVTCVKSVVGGNWVASRAAVEALHPSNRRWVTEVVEIAQRLVDTDHASPPRRSRVTWEIFA